MAFDTAVNILNDAAVELGLYSENLADPYDSTDANVILLCRLLKSTGQELLRAHPWSHLQKTHTFSTADGTASYALPTDFARMTERTQWNRDQALPLMGPLSAQGWQLLQAITTASPHQMFRIFGDLFYISPTPSSVETVALEYQSRYWVDLGGGSTPDSETPTDGTDSLFFDRLLLLRSLKLAYMQEKGFDTSAAQRLRDEAMQMAIGADSSAPVLSLNSRGVGANRLLDRSNIPDTGYGT